MSAHEADRVTFANPDHDFPKFIHYWRLGDDRYAAIDDGTEAHRREFHWQLVPVDR
jgi:hypothetical protein